MKKPQLHRERAALLALEQRAQAGMKGRVLVDDDPRPLKSARVLHEEVRSDGAGFSFEQIERYDTYYVTAKGDPPPAVDEVRAALIAISNIASGKKGANGKRRHPMPRRACDGTPLPDMVVPGDAQRNAGTLIGGLNKLAREAPQTFQWLLAKWLNATDAQQGLIRLDGKEDLRHVERLGLMPGIVFKIELAPVAAKRVADGPVKKTHRLRILFRSEGSARTSERGNRSAGPVRWVLTWIAALTKAGVNAGPFPMGGVVVTDDRGTVIYAVAADTITRAIRATGLLKEEGHCSTGSL